MGCRMGASLRASPKWLRGPGNREGTVGPGTLEDCGTVGASGGWQRWARWVSQGPPGGERLGEGHTHHGRLWKTSYVVFMAHATGQKRGLKV